MNRVSLTTRRLNRCRQTSLYFQSKRRTTAYDHFHSKYNRPDRWRVEPFPIVEPYHANLTGFWGDIKRMDGGRYGGKGKMWTYHYQVVILLYVQFILTFYIGRQFIEYENIFTWGKEEALAQMNYRSMRDEELIYLWVRYNQLKQGLISESEIFRPEIKNDYGWDDIY